MLVMVVPAWALAGLVVAAPAAKCSHRHTQHQSCCLSACLLQTDPHCLLLPVLLCPCSALSLYGAPPRTLRIVVVACCGLGAAGWKLAAASFCLLLMAAPPAMLLMASSMAAALASLGSS